MRPIFFVLFFFACDRAPAAPEYQAVMPDGRTTPVETVAPEFARSAAWLTSTPNVVCSTTGECRDVVAMRPCPSVGTMICFDPDQTKCIQCKREKAVLQLGATRH